MPVQEQALKAGPLIAHTAKVGFVKPIFRWQLRKVKMNFYIHSSMDDFAVYFLNGNDQIKSRSFFSHIHTNSTAQKMNEVFNRGKAKVYFTIREKQFQTG